MKTAIIITARLGSKRLPEKILLPLGGKPVIRHIIDRAKSCTVDAVIFAIPTGTDHDRLADIAHDARIHVYRGDPDDRLGRMLAAAKYFEIDAFATMDHDDPFCDPYLMQSALLQLRLHGEDIITIPEGMIVGSFTHAIRTEALEKVVESKKPGPTESVLQYFKAAKGMLIEDLAVSDKLYFHDGMRLTLDYPEDYEFFKRVWEEMEIGENTTDLRKISLFLRNREDILSLNAFRRDDWLKNKVGMT